MQNKFKNFTKSSLLAFAFSASVPAMAEIKVAVIDLQKAFQESKRGQEARDKLEKEYLDRKKKIDSEQDSLKKASEDFQKKSATMSEKARQEKGMDLQKRMGALQELVAKSDQEIRSRESELSRPIIEGLRATAEKIGKNRGFNLVMDVNLVVYAANRSDITADVIKEFDDSKK